MFSEGIKERGKTGLEWVNNLTVARLKALSANPTKWSNTLEQFYGVGA